jgi:ABC-type dipeptide/oligopeptide/nickel transport system permease subunit
MRTEALPVKEGVGGPARRSKLSGLLRLLRREPSLTIGLVISCTVLFVAIFAPLLAPYQPNEFHSGHEFARPGSDFLLGTDRFGRDTLSRLIYGARIAMIVGFGSTMLAFAIGVPIGLAAGYFRGRVDQLLNSTTDVLLSFPQLILALFLLAIMGRSVNTLIVAIALMLLPTFARQARAPALSESRKDYVTAARAMGATHLRIIGRHIAPNIMSSVIVRASVALPFAILAEAGLAFLGLGVPVPTATWGSMLGDGRTFLETKPLLAIFPGVAISFTVMGFSLLGDGLRDALDPRLR